MYMITESKPFEELLDALSDVRSVYVIGCGTCATLLHTGGTPEVLSLGQRLAEAGKEVTGWMVIPTACDDLSAEALKEQAASVAAAEALVVLSCALGVQTITRFADKPVYPGLNTLFFGKRDSREQFTELCIQCGNCVLGKTAGVCPMTACAKSLVNGPCGGYRDGKCEVDRQRDCAWVQIFTRLEQLGRAGALPDLPALKDYSKMGHPRRVAVPL
ncbi:MAG: methylenetetrahydrofolate reductase C-terminal domain-containing protein [Chloroflexota bacterium]